VAVDATFYDGTLKRIWSIVLWYFISVLWFELFFNIFVFKKKKQKENKKVLSNKAKMIGVKIVN
jgi:hypothetical protein